MTFVETGFIGQADFIVLSVFISKQWSAEQQSDCFAR
jgi:hypothetical protein